MSKEKKIPGTPENWEDGTLGTDEEFAVVSDPLRLWDGLDTNEYFGVEEQPCLWDKLPEDEKNKPQLLNCPCPKCSWRC